MRPRSAHSGAARRGSRARRQRREPSLTARRLTPLMLFAVILLVLAAFSSPDLPMEAIVDGYPIVLGKTTMQDLLDRGYEAHPMGMPGTIRENAKYVPFYYSLDRGAGDQIFVTACVPWGGSANVGPERGRAATEGVIRAVRLRIDATEDVEVLYDGMRLAELSFEHAAGAWKAKEDSGAGNAGYRVSAKRGTLRLAPENSFQDTFFELTVQLSEREFEKMQKG